MFHVAQDEFEKLINNALEKLPSKYINRLNNVAIVTADWPSRQQRAKLHLHQGQTLFGLYEGIPLTQRGAGYNLVLPDIITIFKLPIENSVNNIDELSKAIHYTLWHEIAHYFGLDHKQIHKLDKAYRP